MCFLALGALVVLAFAASVAHWTRSTVFTEAVGDDANRWLFESDFSRIAPH